MLWLWSLVRARRVRCGTAASVACKIGFVRSWRRTEAPQTLSEVTMSLGKIKTEMKGTGGGRWMYRSDAKKASKKTRRLADKRSVREAVAHSGPRGPQERVLP